MSRILKAIILGVLTGILGVVIVFFPLGLALEEDSGLNILFKMRGIRQAPPEVVVVSLDKRSSEKLNLPNDYEKWPRSLHARLTEILAARGAEVIAFDIFFEEPRSSQEDLLFARAMNDARNVILVAALKREKIVFTQKAESFRGDINIERMVPPIPPLARSSVALAPFPLPKIPVKVSQYWTFKTAAGDTPTLPVVVLQVFTLTMYEEFTGLLHMVDPSSAESLPDKEEIMHARSIVQVMQRIRGIFKHDPGIAEKMLNELQRQERLRSDGRTMQMLTALIKMYKSPDNQYINFYGPAQTITTVPYHQVLETAHTRDLMQEQFDFTGKAVFIGHSESLQPEQKDGFYTVFSQPNGLDINGVEIAATAFANLLEDLPLRVLRFGELVLVIMLFGLAIGILCRLLSPAVSLITVLGISLLYGAGALYQFTAHGVWFPLVVPLFFQVPFGFFGAVVWKYIETNKERQAIRKAFSYYLPDEIVDRLSRNIDDIGTGSQIVNGMVLYTDLEHYTMLSETLEPEALSRFMNEYYQTVFEPVKRRGGIVSNVVADSMLALWVTIHPDVSQRRQACEAALDIENAVKRFSHTHNDLKVATRIGLHFGKIFLGNVGAMDHYEYRPIGDIVNTATRIEGLNKYLHTHILMTEEVIKGIDAFLTREIGQFLVVGKTKPITIHELLCPAGEAGAQQKDLCARFGEATGAFRRRAWQEAIDRFHDIVNDHKDDGPSLLYLQLCKEYQENPPGESWDGIIRVEKK